MKKTIWKKRTESNQSIQTLVHECGLSELSAAILRNRGYNTPEKALAFLEPTIKDMMDPFELPDMQKAVDRILEARENGEKVCIHGDYDVDGTTAVSMLMIYFQKLNIDTMYYIPKRLREGYGLNCETVDLLAEKKVDLIITVDNGISCVAEAKRCQEKGISLIITDHHECPAVLPEACAVVDAKREDSTYSFKELCGAGVALKLIQALDQSLDLTSDLQEYFECAAVATISDIVPLKAENRIITYQGLKYINGEIKNRGLKALIQSSELKTVNEGSIGFKIGPKINAMGRLADAKKIVALYTAKSDQEAEEIAALCSAQNTLRQEIEKAIAKTALQKIQAEKRYKDDIIVVDGKDWHPGVIGIVASRIQEFFYKPIIVIAVNGQVDGRASCRSIEGFNIHQALVHCKEHLVKFGGHAMAAGFSIQAGQIDAFRQAMNDYAADTNIKKYFIQKIHYDQALKLSDINADLVEDLEKFHPCGIGNPAPIFKMTHIKSQQAKKIGSDLSHLSVQFGQIRGIGFNLGHILDEGEGEFSALVKPQFNEFRKVVSVQLLIKDIKWDPIHHHKAAWELLEIIKVSDLDTLMSLNLSDAVRFELTFNRDKLKLIYQVAKSIHKPMPIETILSEVKELSSLSLQAGLRILKEAEIASYQIKDGLIFCKINENLSKKDIQTLPFMVKLKVITTY